MIFAQRADDGRFSSFPITQLYMVQTKV